jgi:hypothetical protein
MMGVMTLYTGFLSHAWMTMIVTVKLGAVDIK